MANKYLTRKQILDARDRKSVFEPVFKIRRYDILSEGIMALFKVCYRDNGDIARDDSLELNALKRLHHELGSLIEDIERGEWDPWP